jgi:outer membrane protein assembly factor BamD (BamD/ComL family)
VGRKYFRKWKHVLLCTAGIIILLFSGCATLEELQTRNIAKKNLLHSRELLEAGDFKGSLQESRKVLAVFVNGSPGDEALFNIGLVYAHYANTDKNYKKSLIHFNKIINEYPRSPLLVQAKIWVNVLDSLEKRRTKKERITSKKEIISSRKQKLNSKNNELIKVTEHLKQSQKLISQGNYSNALMENQKVLKIPGKSHFKDEALFNIALIYAHYNNPEKDYKKSIQYFTELINRFPQSPLIEQTKIWLDVLNVIEKAKQVDIDIEKKKKELEK